MTTKENRILRLLDILTEHERKVEDIEEKIWQLRIEGNGFIILSQDEIIFNEP